MDAYPLPFGVTNSLWVFNGNTVSTGGWHTWIKPAGKTMCGILCIGAGGDGGAGVIGANSSAAGGGGGGSGGQTIVEIPMALLPNRLFIQVGTVGASADTRVTTAPVSSGYHALCAASIGNAGGNASGGTAGSAGAGASAVSSTNMIAGWAFLKSALAGTNGQTGGTTGAGSSLSLPTAGLHIMGGAGGAGLGASGANGAAGGGITAGATNGFFSAVLGGTAPPDATTAPGDGNAGFAVPEAGFFYYGGTGGASTHGSATGAGLVQSSGGAGAPGCGGGGSGGALTGSTSGRVGKGGPGQVIIYCY